MTTAVIVDAVRTAGGKRNGSLSGWHSADLAAQVLRAIVERNNLDPALVDDVLMGCVSQVGAQALNVGRNAVLAAGFPESVPSTTIDRQCGSSQQAAAFAAQGVIAGAYDIAIAAGVEVMSLVPMGASVGDVKRTGFPFGEGVGLRYAEVGGLIPQGISAERIADTYGTIDGYHARRFADGTELNAGEFSDETEVALCIMETYTSANGELDPELIRARMQKLKQELEGYGALGCGWLIMRTEGGLQARCFRLMRPFAAALLEATPP